MSHGCKLWSILCEQIDDAFIANNDVCLVQKSRKLNSRVLHEIYSFEGKTLTHLKIRHSVQEPVASFLQAINYVLIRALDIELRQFSSHAIVWLHEHRRQVAFIFVVEIKHRVKVQICEHVSAIDDEIPLLGEKLQRARMKGLRLEYLVY